MVPQYDLCVNSQTPGPVSVNEFLAISNFCVNSQTSGSVSVNKFLAISNVCVNSQMSGPVHNLCQLLGLKCEGHVRHITAGNISCLMRQNRLLNMTSSGYLCKVGDQYRRRFGPCPRTPEKWDSSDKWPWIRSMAGNRPGLCWPRLLWSCLCHIACRWSEIQRSSHQSLPDSEHILSVVICLREYNKHRPRDTYDMPRSSRICRPKTSTCISALP